MNDTTDMQEVIELINSTGIESIKLNTSVGEFEGSLAGFFAEITLKNEQIVVLEQWFNLSIVKEESGIAIYENGDCSKYIELNSEKSDDALDELLIKLEMEDSECEEFCETNGECDVCTGECMIANLEDGVNND